MNFFRKLFFRNKEKAQTDNSIERLGKSNLQKQGKILKFTNFNFKLAIIQELMYEQEVLKPKFDVFDFCENYTKRKIDPYDYYDEMVPEVREWFDNLEIPAELASKVTQLYFDGGNEINIQLVPDGTGEDDIFDITAISDEELTQFPNLKRIEGTAIYISDDVKEKLIDKGIEIEE